MKAKCFLAALLMAAGVSANAGGFRVEAPEHINPVYVKEVLINCAGEMVAPDVVFNPDAPINVKKSWLNKADKECKALANNVIVHALIVDLIIRKGPENLKGMSEEEFKEHFYNEEMKVENKRFDENGYEDVKANLKDVYYLALKNPKAAHAIKVRLMGK